MKKSKIFLLFLLFLSLLLTGCYDAREVDDQVYSIVIGLDKGVHNRVRLTVQYATYQGGGSGSGGGMEKGGGGGGEEERQSAGAIVHTIEAPTILEGLDLLNCAVSRRISMVHTKMIVISEALAREGIANYLGPLARYRETRRTMQMVIVKGSAEKFILENKTSIGESISKTIELMTSQAENTGYFPRVSFHDFYRSTISSYGQAYACYAGVNDFKEIKTGEQGEGPLKTHLNLVPGKIPRKGVVKREFIGTAVFSGDRMVGSLDGEETRYFLMVKGLFDRGIITIKDPEKPGATIPLDVRLGRKPKIKTRFAGNRPVIDIDLNIEADVGAIQSRISYENINKINELNKALASDIKRGVEDVVKKTQKDYQSDIFYFGENFAHYFPTIEDWEKYNWSSHYPQAQVNVHVEVNIRRTGLMFESSPIIYPSSDKSGGK